MKTKFTCSRCDASTKVALPRNVRSEIERAMYANHAGMLGIVDTKHGRILIFCSAACAEPPRRSAKRRKTSAAPATPN